MDSIKNFRGNGIDGVRDGKEKPTVGSLGVIQVPGAGDFLADRITDKSCCSPPARSGCQLRS